MDTLQTQALIANAADQRSLVFATLSTAAAAIVFGALEKANNINLAIGTAIFFCLAAVFAAIAALPGKVYLAGSKASEIRHAIDEDTDYQAVLLGLCENNDSYIDHNENLAATRAHIYRFAVFLFVVAVLIALVGFNSLAQGDPQ
ncbi:hypothetical protein [Roseovarius sp.]|uniref:hypothetical protein n=1 Tax=Roseovarius sp. TaxID=1486281 RepID=UPI00260C4118|nr:hypothetical protein [Roseovarius sp.]